MPGSNGLFAQMKPNGAHWYKSNNIFPFGGNITAVGRKRYIWIILLSIYRGGMWLGITTLDCLAYQYLGWWLTAVPAMAPTEQLHSLRRGGGPPIGPRAPRRMYGGVGLPSTCHWQVITQSAANASFSRSQSSTANSQDPL